MDRAIGMLNLDKAGNPAHTHGGMSLQNTSELKEKLLEELVELEKQMDVLSVGQSVDFSMMQTYKEMIHSRQAFFNELSS